MIKRYVVALDPGGASGVSCGFTADSGQSSSAAFTQETKNIHGAAGAVAVVQVTALTTTNSIGQLKVNGSQAFLNNTFNITLDGSGNGSFLARVEGSPSETGTVIFVTFTIQSVTIGHVTTGADKIKGISKVF